MQRRVVVRTTVASKLVGPLAQLDENEHHDGRRSQDDGRGRPYQADPPTVEEIIAVIRAAGDGVDSSAAMVEPHAAFYGPRPDDGDHLHQRQHGRLRA